MRRVKENMKKIEIQVPAYSKKYQVIIDKGILASFANHIDIKTYSSVFIITDSNVSPIYLPKLIESLSKEIEETRIHSYSFEAGEKSKHIETVVALYKALADAKADRNSLIINLGGGVVTDIGGFVASTYLRGVSYINIPTTLEAMVDASVGGKTGINLENLKNYIGIFSIPEAIYIDIDTLKSLPERALLQGYAEVMKHGLIKDLSYFEKVTKKKLTEYTEDELIDIIAGSVDIKAHIVQEDPHERGVRKILNFGHTIGHVIESASFSSNNPLFHGEAVAIGMVAEAYISSKEGYIDEDTFKDIEVSIKDSGLPVRCAFTASLDEMMEMLYTDKKTVKGSIKWSLLTGIGKSEFNIVVSESIAREALRYIKK